MNSFIAYIDFEVSEDFDRSYFKSAVRKLIYGSMFSTPVADFSRLSLQFFIECDDVQQARCELKVLIDNINLDILANMPSGSCKIIEYILASYEKDKKWDYVLIQ